MQPPWKVNTPAFLKEIGGNPGLSTLRVPLQIFANLLGEVGERCSEINDPILNGLMAQLAIYEIADPYSKDYRREESNCLIEEKERLTRSRSPSGVSRNGAAGRAEKTKQPSRTPFRRRR